MESLSQLYSSSTSPAKHLRDRPKKTKWLLTSLLAAAAFLDPISYAMLYPNLTQLQSDLNTTIELANLAGTLTLIGSALAPLYWSLLSDELGRRPVILGSLVLFTVFSVIGGIAQNIILLIVMRVLASFCSCATVVAGTIVVADIWPSENRGFAMSMFNMGPLAGPAIGPVIGGVLGQVWGWRATQYFLAVYSAAMTLALFFTLSETRNQEQTLAQDKNQENQTARHGCGARIASAMIHYVFHPLANVRYLRFPAILSLISLSSTSFGACLMTVTTSQQVLREDPYNLSYVLVGLCYLSFAGGLITGGLLSGTWSDKTAAQRAKRLALFNPSEQLLFCPENRVGANGLTPLILMPMALLLFGWTVQYRTNLAGPLPGPLIGWFLVGFSSGMVFGLVTTTLTELIPPRAGSLVALNALCRNAFAAVAGSLTEPLSAAMGIGWMYTGYAAFSALTLVVIGLFMHKGRSWRENIEEVLQIKASRLAYAPVGDSELVPVRDTKHEAAENANVHARAERAGILQGSPDKGAQPRASG